MGSSHVSFICVMGCKSQQAIIYFILGGFVQRQLVVSCACFVLDRVSFDKYLLLVITPKIRNILKAEMELRNRCPRAHKQEVGVI